MVLPAQTCRECRPSVQESVVNVAAADSSGASSSGFVHREGTVSAASSASKSVFTLWTPRAPNAT